MPFCAVAPHSNFPQNPPVLPPPPEVSLADHTGSYKHPVSLQVQVSLKNLDEWEFDILDCELVTKSR